MHWSPRGSFLLECSVSDFSFELLVSVALTAAWESDKTPSVTTFAYQNRSLETRCSLRLFFFFFKESRLGLEDRKSRLGSISGRTVSKIPASKNWCSVTCKFGIAKLPYVYNVCVLPESWGTIKIQAASERTVEEADTWRSKANRCWMGNSYKQFWLTDTESWGGS